MALYSREDTWIGVTRGSDDSTWACNGTAVTFADWAESEPDNKYQGQTPGNLVYLSQAHQGQWADGGSEEENAEMKFQFMCSYPCVVGEEEGCIPNFYPTQQTTVIVHSSTQSVVTAEVSEDEKTEETEETPGAKYDPILDMNQVMDFIETNYNGHYGTRFVAAGTDVDFFEASATCRDLGGTLPCIRNAVQQEAVVLLNNATLWLGGIDYYEESRWDCESGDSLVWTNWAENQPDDMVRILEPLLRMF